MRLLKGILTALFALAAVIAGVFATVAIALTGAIVLIARRLLRRSGGAAPRTPHRAPPRRRDGDAIEVEATEIPVEPPARLP